MYCSIPRWDTIIKVDLNTKLYIQIGGNTINPHGLAINNQGVLYYLSDKDFNNTYSLYKIFNNISEPIQLNGTFIGKYIAIDNNNDYVYCTGINSYIYRANLKQQNANIEVFASNDLDIFNSNLVFNNTNDLIACTRYDGRNEGRIVKYVNCNSSNMKIIAEYSRYIKSMCISTDFQYLYCCTEQNINKSNANITQIILNNVGKFTGNTWTPLADGIKGIQVANLSLDQLNNLYAVGQFHNASGVQANNVAKWNGTLWSSLSSGTNGEVGTSAIGPENELYIGGNFTEAGGVDGTRYIAKWDNNNNTWSSVANMYVNQSYDRVNSIQFDSNNNLYIAGIFNSENGIKNIAKRTDQMWLPMGDKTGNILVSPDNSVYLLTDNIYKIEPNGIAYIYINNIYIADLYKNQYSVVNIVNQNVYPVSYGNRPN
jgi:hypothetical protein